METQSQEIKQLNITAVFENINHSPITATKMRKIFKLTEEEEKDSPFIEFPKTKILGMPRRQTDIIIEGNRLRVNDKSGQEPLLSTLIDSFLIAFDNLVDKTKLIAYGFNYDILIKTKKKINFRNLLGNSLLKTLAEDKISESDVRVIYTKNNRRYGLEISPTGDPYIAIFHLNAHYASTEIKSSQFKDQLNRNYLELERIINNL